jgi:hypothetical protein
MLIATIPAVSAAITLGFYGDFVVAHTINAVW